MKLLTSLCLNLFSATNNSANEINTNLNPLSQVINTKTGVIEGVFYDTKPIHSVGYQGGKVAAGGISCYVHVGDFSVDEVI